MNIDRGPDRFQALIRQARREIPPQVDVAGRVLTILAAGQQQPLSVSERFFMWLAGISSAVAVPTAVLAFLLYDGTAEPLAEIARAISWVIQ